MSGAVELTAARIDDLNEIMQVMEAAFDPLYGEAWSAAQLLTLFALPSAHVILAREDGRPAGFYAARIAGPESELLLLAVDPQFRRRGLGKLLLEDWQKWASEQGATEYFLEMRADNDAIHLYRIAGFSESGRRPSYYRGTDAVLRDAITMRR